MHQGAATWLTSLLHHAPRMLVELCHVADDPASSRPLRVERLFYKPAKHLPMSITNKNTTPFFILKINSDEN